MPKQRNRLARQIGERIASARINVGLSQRELSEVIGKLPNGIAKYEVGTHCPGAEIVIMLSHALDVSTDYILLGKEDK